jgi:hypothetical protein
MTGTNDGFEDFRRERKRRQLRDGLFHPGGEQEEITRQLEEVEQREAQEVRLNKEMFDFFTNATRTAAQMVSQVSETAEKEHAVQVAQEMSEFLADTLQRAQQFVLLMNSRTRPDVARQEVHPNMQNLVGAQLDGFRHEGNSSARDNHIGLDPFTVDVDGVPIDAPPPSPLRPVQSAGPGTARPQPAPTPQSAPSPTHSIDDHLVADVAEPRVAKDPEAALLEWFRNRLHDEELVKHALRVLVRGQAMTRDEARDIWSGLHERS